MDPRWIITPHEDGSVETASVSGGKAILYRSLWVHDCLEVDPAAQVVTYREQGDIESDDPSTWPGTPLPLRRTDGGWQTQIEQEEWESWVREQEQVVEQLREFDRRFPGVSLTDRIGEAEKRLGLLRAIGHGWVNLAADVSVILERELLNHREFPGGSALP